jgi:hypothetical protein
VPTRLKTAALRDDWSGVVSSDGRAVIPLEIWVALTEMPVVRPHVVARVRAALAAGLIGTPDDVARAMLCGAPYRDAA